MKKCGLVRDGSLHGQTIATMISLAGDPVRFFWQIRGWHMLKTSMLMIVAALLLIGLGNAFAQMGPKMQMSGKNGACPAGTCAKNGGSFAKDVKFCSAYNCKKAKQ
jgi:hypothetical protein